jgi:hypothetical protein
MKPVRLLVFLHAPGDEAALIPVIERALARGGVSISVSATERFTRRFPAAVAQIEATGVSVGTVGRFALRWLRRPGLSGFDALLTATDSSLPVHRPGHDLTLRANRKGLRTYTLQQGLENVGLTYFDDRHGPEVRFAARRILIWGPLASLPAETPEETRARCVTVGITKRFPQRPVTPAAGARPIVAIFENLHWHRYSDDYRTSFFDMLREAAAAMPDVDFVLKPHAKSPWSAKAASESWPPNLRAASESSRMSGLSLATSADRVVTTPSTIALDAAVAGRPVAIAAFGLDVRYYDPLDRIENGADLISFVRREQPAETRSAFVERVLVTGDAAARVVDLIASDI